MSCEPVRSQFEKIGKIEVEKFGIIPGLSGVSGPCAPLGLLDSGSTGTNWCH
jgi:hypothetical protein